MLLLSFDCSFCQLSNENIEGAEDIWLKIHGLNYWMLEGFSAYTVKEFNKSNLFQESQLLLHYNTSSKKIISGVRIDYVQNKNS